MDASAGTVGSNIILSGHNMCSFNMRVLNAEAELYHLTEDLQTVVAGFMDTLPSFRQFPSGRNNYKQANLYRDIVNKE